MLNLKSIGRVVVPGTFSVDAAWLPTQFMHDQLVSLGIDAESQTKRLKEFLRQALKNRPRRYSQVVWEIEFLKYCNAVSGEPLRERLRQLLDEFARIKHLYEGYQHAANPEYRVSQRRLNGEEWPDDTSDERPGDWHFSFAMLAGEPIPTDVLDAEVKRGKRDFYRRLDEFDLQKREIQKVMESVGLSEYLPA